MDASRIFIRGLPPSLTEEQFKKHFATICPITDWNLMAQRRIGYIGYRTHTDALKAIKYFNKSFVRMSRVDVELARSVSRKLCSLLSSNAYDFLVRRTTVSATPQTHFYPTNTECHQFAWRCRLNPSIQAR